jgi:hypothetical protein
MTINDSAIRTSNLSPSGSSAQTACRPFCRVGANAGDAPTPSTRLSPLARGSKRAASGRERAASGREWAGGYVSRRLHQSGGEFGDW